MPTRKPKKTYYYAGGNRVTLEPALDLIAVDDARLAEKLPELAAADPALRTGTPLRGGIRLVHRDDLAADTLAQLQRAGVTQPVYRQGGTTLVALPEVRVEDGRAATLRAARLFAADKVQPIADDTDGRLTLHPISDDGGDAIALANDLIEQHAVASASPRFLRVMPRPGIATI